MFEAYRVAVRLSLVENVSSGILGISRALMKAHGDATALQARLDAMKMPALASGAMIGAGAFGLHMLKGPLDEAAKYQLELGKFATLGFGDHINRQADLAAKGMKTIGTSATENMALLTDAMAVFKNFDEAKMAAPLMAKMKFANEIMFHGQGGESKLMDMLKTGELRGGTKSPEAMERQAEYAQKAIEGSRNRVDPTQMLNAMKYGGIATRMMTDKAFYLRSEPLIQEVGGAGFGTGMSALYSNLAQGRGALTSQQELYRLGLLNKSKVQFNSMGMLKKALPGAFVGEAAFKDGVEGVGNMLLAAFAKHGITKDADVIREIGMVASNQRGARLLTTWYQQRAKIAAQGDANEHAMGLSDAVKKASQMYDGQKVMLGKAWETLMLTLGERILPIAIKALQILNPLLEKANAFLRQHSTITKGLVIGLAGLSSAAAVVGSLGMLGVALRVLSVVMRGNLISIGIRALAFGIGILARALLMNPIGLVITGITLALTALYTYWDKIKSWLPSWMVGGGSHPQQVNPVRTAKQAVNVNVHNTVDYHGLTSRVTHEQAKAASRPQAGSSGYDGGMAAYSPTMAGAGA